jgi:hypothetical protein
MEKKIGLGDIVSLGWTDGYDNGTVCQVHKDGTVDVFRLYTHHAGFSMAGSQAGSKSVICYIGTEVVKDINPDRLTLLRKEKSLR